MSKNKTQITVEPGKHDLFITREFDAPRELVFRAYTEAKLYERWMGPREYKTVLEKFDLRSGGSYRMVHVNPDGDEFAFRGVVHDVLKNERIIQTFEFEGMPGHVCLETAKFESLPNGRTRVVGQSVFQSVADRDGMVASGMEGGVVDSFEKLDELLEEVKKG